MVEIGADTVIIEAEDPVARLSLDLAIQLTDDGGGLLPGRDHQPC